jgi:thiol-disulfide isomerase/thioredoxin
MALHRESRWPLASLLLLAAALAPACSNPPPADAAQASLAVAGGGDGESSQAPDFELEDLGGAVVRLSDSSGDVRLIDFWATWCAPCREEIPMLKELHEGYSDNGLTILAISDEDADIVRPFAEKHEIGYTNLVGGEEIFMKYRALGLPTAYLVDGQGKIVETFFGPKPRSVLEKRIRELLELPPLT